MVYSSADDVDTMIDDQPIVLPEQGQEIREPTPWPQPPASASRPKTPELLPGSRTPETHPLGQFEIFGLVTPLQPHGAVPTLQLAEAPGNSSDLHMDH